MLRALAATLALTALMAAASAQPRPTPAAVPTKAETTAREKLDTEKREVERAKNHSTSEARDRAWDAKTKRTMGGMCRGC
jgi:hypothetical protein